MVNWVVFSLLRNPINVLQQLLRKEYDWVGSQVRRIVATLRTIKNLKILHEKERPIEHLASDVHIQLH